jgi:hypothetical protein
VYFDYKHGVHRWDGESWDEIDIPAQIQRFGTRPMQPHQRLGPSLLLPAMQMKKEHHHETGSHGTAGTQAGIYGEGVTAT